MNTMDNAKVIETMEKYALQKYLEKIMDAKMHKITLFTIFSQTGAPNLSDPAHFVMIEEVAKIVSLNSGCFLN